MKNGRRTGRARLGGAALAGAALTVGNLVLFAPTAGAATTASFS